MARGVASGACTGAANFSGLPPLCGTAPVIVSNDCNANNPTPGTLAGGIFVNGSVTDLLLADTPAGQTIVIYTSTTRRTIIEEGQPVAGQTRVRRQCLKTTFTDAAACNSGGTQWFLLPTSDGSGGAYRDQRFTGVFSPDAATDRGLIFVTGNIGQTGTAGSPSTLFGLRRGTYSLTGVDLTPQYALYQDTTNPARGMRLTVAADGNIFVAGQLNYRIDPRGADLAFSEPIPGDASGTSADDQLNVQNVLGIVSWGLGMAGGVRLSAALTGDLLTQGMVFVANLSGNAAPSGQFSFDDDNGSYRGVSRVLGGVVQKTMGTFGQPSSNRGYERDWVYDERFRYRALAPPAFPGFPNFTAATSLGIDSYTWRLGLF
jgi:hypothetical protein